MISAFDDSPGNLRVKVTVIYAVLVLANAGAWVWAFAAFAGRPVLLGTALLAYTFGLRHAVDVDHIAAIDNVTRKLMQDGKQPVAAGFWFSLGHSTIVVALSAAIAFATTLVHRSFPQLLGAGGLIGASISALFLYAIAAINALVLLDVYRAFRRVRRGAPYAQSGVEGSLEPCGFFSRLLGPAMRLVGSSRRMYPLGVLFGLGFDTATEIGILGIAALEAGKGVPVYTIMVFPLLFTAGMCLLDTTDGVLMLGAYGWAFVKPVRKLWYNLNVTLVSVLVALFVGTLELISIRTGSMPFGYDAGVLGAGIIGIFGGAWCVSALVYRWRRYDDLEPVP